MLLNSGTGLTDKPNPRSGRIEPVDQMPIDSNRYSMNRPVFAFAYVAEIWERLWPLLVPFFIVTCLFVSLSWLGLWQALPDWARWMSFAGFIAAFIASLWPLRQFSAPFPNEIYRRVETASEMSHRPVTAQNEAPVNNSDAFSAALWREHQRRMADQLNNMASGTPRPNGNRFDRFALRAMLPLLAFVALGYSYGTHGGRLTDILKPRIDTQLVLSRLDMWISPPAYTAKAPLYFAASSATPAVATSSNASTAGEGADGAVPSVETLEGSRLSINYIGEENITARYRVADGHLALDRDPVADDGNPSADISAKSFLSTLDQSGTVEILVDDDIIASWQVSVLADTIPVIELDDVPSKALSGALELNYSVADDYGVVSARGIISQPESGTINPNARPLVQAPEFELPLARARAKSGSSKVSRDLSSHPWAGSKVVLTLEAKDDPGQIGTSKPITITLPGRNFVDPMAKALVEQRRLLALDANSAPHVANLLDAVTTHPDVFEIDTKSYLALQLAYRMIVPANDDDKLREAMDILWETALALELGDLSEVERRLREAQEKLSKALENGASDEQIDELMKELRQAMNDFLEQMAKEMAKNPIQQNPMANNQNIQTLTQRDIDKMMKRIEDLAKSGSKDAARELLAEMQRMMDNMRAGQHQQQNQAEGNQLNQALDKLSELMQKQQQLMDETFSMQRREPQQGQDQQGENGEEQQGQNKDQQNGENPDGNNPDGPMTPQEFADAMKQLQEQQKALEKQLGELGQQLQDLGLDPSEGFDEAGKEMGEAGKNLGEGKSGDAAGNQGQALEALRKGAQSMMQQMAGDRNQGGQQQGQAGQNGQDRNRTDPLGRRNDANGKFGDGDIRIPGEIDAQRAREIMEAIRKRLSDPLRPLLERNYLERLLESR